MPAKKPKLARKHVSLRPPPPRPPRPTVAPPEIVTADLGPAPPAKPRPPKPEPPPEIVHVPTARSFGDPAPVPLEAEPVTVPGGPIGRAPCDPPSRT